MANIIIQDIGEFDDEKRHILAPVLIPNRFDLHNDGMSANEVEKACHYYNRNHFGACDMNHVLQVDCATVIESYILEVDTQIGDHFLTKGTWMAKVAIDRTNVGDVVWGLFQSGELTGYSPYGSVSEHKILEE